MNNLRALIFGTILAMSITLPLQNAQAQSGKAFIGYRQRVMKTIGANMGAVGAILKNKLPQKENIQTHAQIISLSSQLIPSAFEKQVTTGPTDAKPGIWEDFDGFKKATEKLQRESKRFAEISRQGSAQEIVGQMKKVGKACKGCHKEYRKAKKNSYKRKK